jgi:PmbA protein
MTPSDGVAVASSAIDAARAAGADAAEAMWSYAQRTHVEARDTTVSKLERTTGGGLSVRLWKNGRRVALATSDVRPDALEDAIARALEQSTFVSSDEFAALPERCGRFEGDLQLYDDAVATRDDAEKIDDALKLERAIRAADPRIINSSGSHYSDAVSSTVLVNSSGFSGAYTTTRASRSSGPVAQDGDRKRTGHYGTAGRFAHELDSTGRVGELAAKRAVQMFGARKPQTARVPVIFERDIAAAVLDDIFNACSAANVAVGNSWLADRVGERLGSELVTIVDDGTMPGRLGSSPFDGEGVPTRRTPVFERGVLSSFLYDTYYARKLGAQTTGNSTGGGIGANNFYLEPGTQTLERLIASTPRGVLILDTIGFATEHATGTYSRGARGFMIEAGELAYPIDEFTVAGNFADMLAAVDGVANDLRFDGSTVAPSFRVAEMTISGN